MKSKPVKLTIVLAIAVALPIESGCRLQAKRSSDFSALATPISYQLPDSSTREPATGLVGKMKTRVKDTAVFVGKGVLFAGALVAWMWLDDDDETTSERNYREKNEGQWKSYWRNYPDVNPAMTAAFQDDKEDAE